MNIQRRDIAVCIILSIVTCGIYGIYWLFCLNEDTNTISAEPYPTSGGMVILLTIVTCGIYGIYWCYKQGEKLDRAAEMRGAPKSERGILYLVLAIIGLSIVNYALMQDTLNNLRELPVGQPQYQQPPYGQPPYGQPYQQPQQPYGQQPPQNNNNNPYQQ